MGWTGGRKKPQPWERLLTVVSCLLQGQSLLSIIKLYDLHYRQTGFLFFFYGRHRWQRHQDVLTEKGRSGMESQNALALFCCILRPTLDDTELKSNGKLNACVFLS